MLGITTDGLKSKKTLEEPEIESLLSEDVTRCAWIDGLGRRIRLRKGSLGEVKTHLLSLDLANLKEHSIMLRAELLRMIEDEDDKALFVFDDKGVSLPIPVFSSITPNHGVPFLLHIMLMLGEYDTELDLRFQSTIRESLSAVGLIGNSTDAEDLKGYSIQLVKRTCGNTRLHCLGTYPTNGYLSRYSRWYSHFNNVTIQPHRGSN